MYVNPEEYYAMEARIQTQESQIIECEGALKQRNEEVKSLKYERDDLIDRWVPCRCVTVSLIAVLSVLDASSTASTSQIAAVCYSVTDS